jgi:hypothetical protein
MTMTKQLSIGQDDQPGSGPSATVHLPFSGRTVIRTPVNAQLDEELSAKCAYPVAVGTLGGEALLVLASRAITSVNIVSVETGLLRFSIDLGTEAQSIAIASDGILVGSRKGLSKFTVAPELP